MTRSSRNSWWKCQQSLFSSSRPLTFQCRGPCCSLPLMDTSGAGLWGPLGCTSGTSLGVTPSGDPQRDTPPAQGGIEILGNADHALQVPAVLADLQWKVPQIRSSTECWTLQFLVGRLHARCCANDRAWVKQWRKLLLRSCIPLSRWLTSLRAGRTDSQVQAWMRQSSPTVAVAEKSVETPHVFLDKVVDMPVVCNNRCLVSGSAGAVHRQL